MLVSDLIQGVYYAYRGKGATRTPVFGSEKANTALSICNRKKNEWANDSRQNWVSNFALTSPNEPGTVTTTATVDLVGTDTFFTDYQVGDKITVSGETERTIATITSDTALTVTVAFTNSTTTTFTHSIILKAGVQSYKLHRNVLNPSDHVVITLPTQTINFSLSNPQNRTADAYISGRNPKVLTLVDTIESTSQLVDGVLDLPAYYLPDDMVNATDTVPVDNPEWLVYSVAAELARNDPAKDDQFANLVGMANDIYEKMIYANRDIGFLQGRQVTNAMPVIGETTEDDWTL